MAERVRDWQRECGYDNESAVMMSEKMRTTVDIRRKAGESGLNMIHFHSEK
jgi:hypothetical protein